jgi:OsmC-like protein.
VVETVAKERGITIDDLRLGVSGTIDLRGFLGVPGVSPSFESIDGWVRLRADIDAEQFEGLIAETERRCPLYNLFRDAGVTPEIRWSLNV